MSEKTQKTEESKDFTPEKGAVDLTQRVKLVATKSAPYHEEDEKFEAAPALAEMFIKQGFAKKA